MFCSLDVFYLIFGLLVYYVNVDEEFKPVNLFPVLFKQ